VSAPEVRTSRGSPERSSFRELRRPRRAPRRRLARAGHPALASVVICAYSSLIPTTPTGRRQSASATFSALVRHSRDVQVGFRPHHRLLDRAGSCWTSTTAAGGRVDVAPARPLLLQRLFSNPLFITKPTSTRRRIRTAQKHFARPLLRRSRTRMELRRRSAVVWVEDVGDRYARGHAAAF
jgi:hypothetical protein